MRGWHCDPAGSEGYEGYEGFFQTFSSRGRAAENSGKTTHNPSHPSLAGVPSQAASAPAATWVVVVSPALAPLPAARPNNSRRRCLRPDPTPVGVRPGRTGCRIHFQGELKA